MNSTYIYKSCSTNKILATSVPGNNESIGSITRYITKTKVECWQLIGIQNTWLPNYPANYNIDDYFSGFQVFGSYTKCDECLNPITNNVVKGSLTIVSRSFINTISNQYFTLKVNNKVVNTSLPVITNSESNIKLSVSSNNKIINPKFTNVFIYNNFNNQLLLSISVDNLQNYEIPSFVIPDSDIRVDAIIKADNFLN